jgi:hypothetical protein
MFVSLQRQEKLIAIDVGSADHRQAAPRPYGVSTTPE